MQRGPSIASLERSRKERFVARHNLTWGVCLWPVLAVLASQSAEPTFVVSSMSGEWWQQVSVEPEAAALEMEIIDGERWQMTHQSWGDFTSGERLPTGTVVQLFATYPDGEEVASTVFRYLVEQPGEDCVPDCAGSECGGDGCGGSCGACAIDWACDAGQCIEEPPVTTEYDPDFEVQAGTSGEWWQQVAAHGGAETVLMDIETGAQWLMERQPWGVFTHGGYLPRGTLIRLTGTDVDGRQGQTLWFAYLEEQPITDDGVCVPDCEGLACGDDGCGEVCGVCDDGYSCEAGQCVEDPPACEPDCAGLVCGDDGCGGSCGTCDAGHSCEAGLCVEEPPCVPDCAGAVCGDDACGGSCGSCEPGRPCVDGQCSTQCVPPWNPSWGYDMAGNWWVEFRVSGGADVVDVWLEADDRPDAHLTYMYGKWFGSPGPYLATGTPVRLHAVHDIGQTAQTHWFAYLDEVPTTDPCGGTGPAGCGSFANGLLTIAFDDAWASQYEVAAPALASRGVRASLFFVVEPIDEMWGGYLNVFQAHAFVADGHEVGSHSMDHPDLTTLTDAEIDWQLSASQRWLQDTFGQPVGHFAAPFTAIDDRVIATAQRYYDSLCCVQNGINLRGQDRYRLRAHYVLSSTSVADVAALIDETVNVGGWRILGFHRFTTGSASDPYSYRLADFEAILDHALASGIDIVTYSEAVAQLACE
jgi:peptidoglycan/xylan/chitin deacetylase (PgdA/CDA1 family)